MKTSFVGSLTLVAMLSLVTGCAQGPTIRPAPPLDPVAAAPDPAPQVTVTASPEPLPVRPDFGFTFYEEAQLGATWTQMAGQLNMPIAGLEKCPWFADIWSSGPYFSTYAFSDAGDADSASTFFYSQNNGAPDSGPFPRNAEGVGIGSSQAEIVAAYPDADVATGTDVGAGEFVEITVEDPASDSKYVFAMLSDSPVANALQWGPDAGSQWTHLCSGL